MADVEVSQLDRIEAKVDELRSFCLEILTWKTEVEEAMAAMQSGGIMSIVGGLFGKQQR